ncbi:MAG: hypothetical protein Q8K89_11380 [Actinomycetota bacterium]|nr:hypothetical protein [Actinomycetota bacterium]
MSEERSPYTGTRPAQFRLPLETHEFLAREAASRGLSKTDIVLEALADLKSKRFEAELEAGYKEMNAEDLAEAKVWEPMLADGLEAEEW